MTLPAVAVTDLRKSYGQLEALRGVTFEIQQGEVFGLLGPNGAGKTTTVEVLEGYRAPDGGSVATEIRYRRDGQEVLIETHEPTKVLNELTGEALARGVELEGLLVRRPTLEEIYLELTEGGGE